MMKLWKQWREAMIEQIAKEFNLWPHQKEALYRWEKANYRLYIHFDVGLGKTRTALAIAKLSKARKLWIIAPLSAQPSWVQEMAKTNFHIDYDIMTYETFLSKDFPLPTKDTLVIFDEAHRLKNWQAKTTKKAYKYFANHPYKLMLSGTMADKLWDVYAQFKILVPEKVAMSWSGWINTFFVLDSFFKPLYPKVPREKIFEPFVDHIYSVSRQEVFENLPAIAKQYIILNSRKLVSFDDEETVLTSMEDDMEVSRQLTLWGNALGNFIKEYRQAQRTEEKFSKVIEFLADNPKSIVFCHFKETVAYYKSLLGNQAYYIKGDDKRDLPLVLQTKGDKPLIATYSLKEGVNLQFYNQIIFHTLPLAYRDFVQAVGRVYRAGQENPVSMKVLVNRAFETDPLVVQILKKKADVLRYIRQDKNLFRRFTYGI